MASDIPPFPLLIALSGPLEGQQWHIQGKMVFGRSPNCDIVISDRQISRMHSALSPDNQGVLFEDLGSKNGSFVNGEPITDPVFLTQEDVIQIALVQKFKVAHLDRTTSLQLGGQDLTNKSGEFILRIDQSKHSVRIGKEEISPPLSRSQYLLLNLLFERSPEIISREELITKVWGKNYALGISDQALDALIRRLRDRLGSINPSHQYIITVRGHGLRLDNPEE